LALSGVPRLRWRVPPERRERGASGTAVSVLAGLDRPDLTDKIRVGGRGEKTGSMRVWSAGVNALLAIEFARPETTRGSA